MPSSYTTSLRLTLPANGELAGSWGSTVNTGVTSLAEAAIAGTSAVTMTDADATLTVLNGAADQSRNMFITLTGTLTAARNVICPSVSKLYVVTNNTTGSQTITFKTSAGSGIAVASGQRKMLYCNGTNVLDATTGVTSLLFDAGTVSAPSIAFVGNTSTGFWLPTTSTLAASTAGVERLRIDASGNLGVGTAAPTTKLHISGAAPSAGSIGIRVQDTAGSSSAELLKTGATYSYAGVGANETWLYSQGTSNLTLGPDGVASVKFVTNGLERARIDSSGNLGIGTTSPYARIHVDRDGPRTLSLAPANRTAGSASYILMGNSDSGGTSGPNVIVSANRELQFGVGTSFSSDTGGTFTAHMRIDSSGNLGLGVVPSAWSTSGGANIQTSSGSLMSFSTTQFNVLQNAYYSGANYVYKNTAAASGYQQSAGGHLWYNAPSGTAGNAITFTQAMTLDSSGNLLVGTTSAYGVGLTLKPSGEFSSAYSGTSGNHCLFLNNNGTVGSITSSGSATFYNTSSDYRLKDITGPITTSGAYIDSLHPVEGTWKVDGSTFVGLIAHEVQEVSRTTVATGVKDGAQVQALDYANAELVANLIAEIQSLRARMAAMEAAWAKT